MLEVAGLRFLEDDELPEGFVATEALVIVLGIDAEGGSASHFRATPGLPNSHAIGLLTVASDRIRHYLQTDED